MNLYSSNNLTMCPRARTGCPRAFTLIDLIAVLAVAALLAAVSLSLGFTTKERVLRAECVSNLRQIGLGWNIYQENYNQVMPCHWPGFTVGVGSESEASPWRTYEAYRVVPGTGQLEIGDGTEAPGTPSGPWNLGVLFATKLISSPKVFYCPATAGIANQFSYEYYTTISNSWPSTPVGTGDYEIRVGYNYCPQLRAVEVIGNGYLGPKLAVTPAKWTDLDPKKSIATDLVDNLGLLSHQASGTVAGLNALFPDGRVVFQNARSNPQAFNVSLWEDPYDPADGDVGQNPSAFRHVMSLWTP